MIYATMIPEGKVRVKTYPCTDGRSHSLYLSDVARPCEEFCVADQTPEELIRIGEEIREHSMRLAAERDAAIPQPVYADAVAADDDAA